MRDTARDHHTGTYASPKKKKESERASDEKSSGCARAVERAKKRVRLRLFARVCVRLRAFACSRVRLRTHSLFTYERAK